MSNFVYSTQKDFDGPWLISRNALKELDDIFENISERFANESKEQIEIKVNEYLATFSIETQNNIREETRERITRDLKLQRSAKLTLSNSKYLQGMTIKELLAIPELQDEAPTGIEVEASASNRKASLQLVRGIFGRPRLNISASPETDNSSREAFAELQQWATNNQSPLWQQLWSKITSYHWIFFLILLSFSAMTVPSSSENVEKYLDPIVIELLSDGISNNEFSKAIELLLQYQIKQVPQEVTQKPAKWFSILFFGGLAASIILSICPTMVIGIGRNEKKLLLWKNWTKFVGITIPGVVFASFIWPYIIEWLKNIL